MEKKLKHFYASKIISYLDGSLSEEEKAEFEAFVLTHPEFEQQIKSKKEEVDLIRKMIPVTRLSPLARESLEGELRASVFVLLKEEPKTLMDTVKLKFEDFFSR